MSRDVIFDESSSLQPVLQASSQQHSNNYELLFPSISVREEACENLPVSHDDPACPRPSSSSMLPSADRPETLSDSGSIDIQHSNSDNGSGASVGVSGRALDVSSSPDVLNPVLRTRTLDDVFQSCDRAHELGVLKRTTEATALRLRRLHHVLLFSNDPLRTSGASPFYRRSHFLTRQLLPLNTARNGMLPWSRRLIL